ncbi:restriction endonuclease subunit S [Vibrio fluvialis]
MENLSKESLPLGWELQLYKDVVETISTNGKKVNQKQYETSGTYPIFDQGQSYCSGYLSDEDKVINAKFPVLVFGDHTRAVKYVKEPFVAGADGVKVLEANGKVIPELLLYFTQYLAVAIKDKGYARHYQWVAKEQIGIPPLREQRRIVEKIEELFSELDSGIKSLTKAKQQLSVYRQALLKQAFEGKLTAQWRAENLNQLEDSEKLLSTVRKERQVRYEKMVKAWEVDVGLWEQNGKKGKKPTKPAKLQDISELPSDNQIPDSWVTMVYGDLCSVVRNGVSKKPTGNDGIKIFRISAVRAMKFDMEDYRFISDDKDEFKSFYLERGDLVFTRYNGTRNFVGVAAQYHSDERRLFPDKLIQTRPNLPSIDVAYLERAVNCGSSRKFVESRIRTTAGQSGVSGSDIKQIPVPLCSLKEQREINSILDEKLSVIDNLERENELNLQKSELLRQSILKKAFFGQLVSQDPEDEPANELLKKIAIEKEELAEKEKAEKAAARKKKATAKKTVKS